MATNYYDLIIVGGGPGGSAAGIECARRGLRILLIEMEAFPRSRPGETLPPGIDPLADTLGVNLCGFLRFAGYWTQWNCAEMRFISFGREGGSAWQGFHAWRAEFDSRLLQRAIDSGVEIRQPCRAMRPLTECRRVVGVLTDQGPVQAAFVVDASGCRQWLAQHLVLATARVTPRLLASYG